MRGCKKFSWRSVSDCRWGAKFNAVHIVTVASVVICHEPPSSIQHETKELIQRGYGSESVPVYMYT